MKISDIKKKNYEKYNIMNTGVLMTKVKNEALQQQQKKSNS